MPELAKEIAEAALYGLRFAAEKERLFLGAVKAEWIAEVVAKHALSAAIHAGEVVPMDVHARKVDHLERRVKQFENWWAGAKVQADHQLQRVQAALDALEDHELAQRLADEVGVILPEREDAEVALF